MSNFYDIIHFYRFLTAHTEKKVLFCTKHFKTFTMETQIGFELCTGGSAEKLTIKGKCSIRQGTLMIHSPVFPMLELSRSTDYKFVQLRDNIENLYPLIVPNISSPQQIYSITPFLLLTEEQQRYFIQCVDKIREKEEQLGTTNNSLQRNIMSSVISLLKQETILEHALLFIEQMGQAELTISRKRQVLTTFLLALNQEYKQQRAVQYYAAQQNLSSRHFADIIKQESGYTPMEWINMVTINQAKNLLRQRNILVKEVADELGFPEQFTFRKYFKVHTGMSPTEFQRE